MDRYTYRDQYGKCWLKSFPCDVQGEAVDEFARYEDLEKQGRFVELPCVAGDTVYTLYNGEVYKSIALQITIHSFVVNTYNVKINTELYIASIFHDDGRTMPFHWSGTYMEDVFLTYEEAEAKLKEMENLK